MPIDASIYQNVGKFPSLNDFDEQANRLQSNKLALMLQQAQVNDLPTRNQLLQYQVQAANIGNQQKQQLSDLVARITRRGQPQGTTPGDPSGGPAAAGVPGGAGAPGGTPGAPGGTPGAPSGSAALGGMNFADVVGLKALGGPDLSNDFKMSMEGFSHTPGSEVTGVDGSRRRVAQLNPGETQDPATGAVSNLPGSVESAATRAAALKGAETGAVNEQTLAPLDRIDPATGRPYATTVGGLVRAVKPQQAAPTGAMPIDGLSPQQQQAALTDMRARGQNPATMNVNGQPAFADLQTALDAAKGGGAEGLARFQAAQLPRLLAIQDPAQRQKALAGFTADLQTPTGTPIHSMGASPAAGGFSGFAGPAEMAGAKAKAEADVKAATQPGIDYNTDTAKSAAAYKTALDSQVSTGQDLMQRINEAKDALSKFQPGMGAETRLNVARFAQSLGASDSIVNKINNGDVAAKQEFMKLSAQTAMESLKQAMQGSGRITQAEFKVFQANNPNIELDSKAIDKIYDFGIKVYQRTLGEQQAYSKYTAGGGNPSDWQAKWAAQQDPTGTGAIGVKPAASGFKYIGVAK